MRSGRPGSSGRLLILALLPGSAVALHLGSVGGPPAEPLVLHFPVYDEGTERFSGYAFTHFADSGTASLSFEVRTSAGDLLASSQNPALVQLEAGTQLARLGTQLVGAGPARPDLGWARVESDSEDIGALFLQGEVGAAGIEKLDGVSAARAEPAYCFTRIYQGLQVFPSLSGPRNATTTLVVANPGEKPVEATFRLFSPLGQQLARTVRTVPALGRLSGDIKALFDEDALNDGYVCVESSGGPTAGLELIRLPDTILMLPGQVPSPATRLFSAQLAHGESIFTSLKLVNPGVTPRSVILTAFLQDPAGNVSTRVTQLVLSAGQALQRPVDQLFALGPGGSQTIVGSIQVEASGAGLLGDVVFGDPRTAAFGAALPLQDTPLTRLVFSHVANGPTNVVDPSFDPFTGVAIFNVNDAPAAVQLEVFAPDGTPIGAALIPLRPRGRLSELIEFLLPETAEMSSGFVRLTATRPVVAQQIFGNTSLQFLSAIPAASR